mmetsp:Transcript_11192/g.18789  ORF Transcript_11192/g.18789 Transcript_11192/m.18789 type:complete len:217 (+) Transcript_11192:1332-1982(+)
MLRLRGISALITVCTPGMSNPRAATSVATMTSASCRRNFSRAMYLCACVTSPCSSTALMPIRVNRAQKRCAFRFISKNTMTRFPNERSTSDSSIDSTVRASTAESPGLTGAEGKAEERNLINSWTSLGAKLIEDVPAPPELELLASAPVIRTRMGRFKDSFAKSSTLAVIVAENSMVCLAIGQYLTSSVTSSSKPKSSRRSASSSTSTSSSSKLTE